LDILEETGLMNLKLVDRPIDPSTKPLSNQREPMSDPELYRRLDILDILSLSSIFRFFVIFLYFVYWA